MAYTRRKVVRPNKPVGTHEQHDDDECEAENLLGRRAKVAADEILQHAVGEARGQDTDRVLEAADDGDRERLETDEKAHVAADADQRADQDSADCRQHAAERIGEADHAIDVNTNRERSLAIKCSSAQRPAKHGAAIEEPGANCHHQHDYRNQQLEGIDPGAQHRTGSSARALSSPRGDFPNTNRTTFSRMMPTASVLMTHATEPRSTNGRTASRSSAGRRTEQQDREQHGERRRPAEVDDQDEGRDRAQHHGRTLRSSACGSS